MNEILNQKFGDEFATARRVFTNRLPGDTAWRYGRPPKAAVEAVA